MIAKRIPAPKGTSGFQRLGAYVLNVKTQAKGADPASWERLNAYILDAGHGGEKVAWARVSNCVSTDPGWAVKEIIATQGRNTRSRKGKDYHLVASFPEGERPTREQLEDIEDRLCEAIGLAAHQRVSAVHQNTENWHLHVAICTVHPVTFRNVAPFQDHFRLQEACAELEVKHGLAVDNHTLAREPGVERRTGRADQARPFLAWVQQEAAAALLDACGAGQGWQHLHGVAAAYGLAVKLRGAGLVIGHAKDQRLHVKASAVDRGLSLKALTDALGSFEPAGSAAYVRPRRTSYTRPDRQRVLYAAYAQERTAATRAQAEAALALRKQHRAYAAELAAYYRTRMEAERASAQRGILRHDSIQHVARKRHEDYAARLAREKEEFRHLREAYRPITWQGWLEARAAEGNVEALALLSTMRGSVKPVASERQGLAAAPGQERQQPHRGRQSQNDAERER